MRNRLFVYLFALWFSALFIGCSSTQSASPDPSPPKSVALPARELTAVGMTLVDAKAAITDLGFTWVVLQNGAKALLGAEVPGRFVLQVEEGIVVRQNVDGVAPFVDVDGLDIEVAEAFLNGEGLESRIIAIDGFSLALPNDFVPGRYNFSVADGKIVGHDIDVVRLDVIWEPNGAK